MQQHNTKTPCVGVCSTIYGDEVCRGCHRFYDEIIQWNGLDSNTKIKINSRLELLQAQYTQKYFQLPPANSQLHHKLADFIKKHLVKYNIHYNQPANIYTQLYKFIKQLINNTKNNPKNPQNILDTLNQFEVLILTPNKTNNIKTNNIKTNNIKTIISGIDEHIYHQSNKIFTQKITLNNTK